MGKGEANTTRKSSEKNRNLGWNKKNVLLNDTSWGWIFTMAVFNFFDATTRFFTTETNLMRKGDILCNHSGSGAVFQVTFFDGSGANKLQRSWLPFSLQNWLITCCKSSTQTDGSGTSLPMALKQSSVSQHFLVSTLGATTLWGIWLAKRKIDTLYNAVDSSILYAVCQSKCTDSVSQNHGCSYQNALVSQSVGFSKCWASPSVGSLQVLTLSKCWVSQSAWSLKMWVSPHSVCKFAPPNSD